MAEAARYFAPPEALARFNLGPLNEIDESWRATLALPDLVERVTQHPAAAAHYSQYMLERAGIKERFVTNFSRQRSRLALMETDAFQSLLLHVGVALRSGDIRRELDRTRQTQIREAIGNDLFDFAVRIAPLYGEMPSLDVAVRDLDYADRCSLIGAKYAIDKTAARDRAYLIRFCWKLPRSVAEVLSDINWTDDGSADLPPLVRRIIKDRFQTWRPLFDL